MDSTSVAAADSIASSLAWPSGQEGIALAAVLFAALLAVSANGAPPLGRTVAVVAIAALPVAAFSLARESVISLELDGFLAPARAVSESQVVDLGAHSTWYDARDVGETLGLTLQSSWIQTVAKWLGVVCAYGQLFLLSLAAAVAVSSLAVRSLADAGLVLIVVALLGAVGLTVADSLWIWSVPGTGMAAPLAIAFNQAASAAHLLSFFLLAAGGLGALFGSRARLLGAL